MPDKFDEVIQIIEQGNKDMLEVEKLVIGNNHAEVGAYLTELWGLSENITEAIYYHHKPELSGQDKITPLSIVYLANNFLKRYDQKDTDDAPIELNPEYINRIGVADKISEWENAIHSFLDNLNEK